jgi:carbon storage regulator
MRAFARTGRAEEATHKEVPMLVLSRKQGESIVIDGGIRITVVGVKGKAVRLAIEAPRSTRVDREEVAMRVERDGFQNCGPVESDVLADAGDAVEVPNWSVRRQTICF